MDADDLVKQKLNELKQARAPKINPQQQPHKYPPFYVGVVKNTPYFPDTTMITLMQVASLMGRVFRYITITGSALSVARGMLFKEIKRHMIQNGDDIKNTYVLLIDSDMLTLNTPQELVEIFKDAEAKNINIAGYYKKVDGSSVIIGTLSNDTAPVLLNEKHEDWAKYNTYVPTYKRWYYPVGFYYGNFMPFDYVWHMDLKGEDIYFNEENSFLWERTYIDKRIKLGHIKEIVIQ